MYKVYPKKKVIIGIDEVGRGSLAGPVCSAAVVLFGGSGGQASKGLINEIKDSKQLTFSKRLGIYQQMISQNITYGLGWSSVQEIDNLNILNATLLSMVRAFEICKTKLLMHENMLSVKIDGIFSPRDFNGPWGNWTVETETIKNGDKLVKEIAASSILAKVTRDNLMIKLDKKYPDYLFKKNMGYGTQQHIKTLKSIGPCPVHRKTFNPIKKL